MVGYNPKDWSTLIFHTYSKEVFRRLFPSMLGIGAFTAAVCWVELEWMDEPVNLSNAVHSLLGFVGTFAWWTVAVVMAVFYVLVSVELIAEEIENPFGTDDNDLPLDELCAVIRRDVALLLPVESAATLAASPGIEPGSSV